MSRGLKLAGGVVVAALVAIQFFRPSRTNPPSDPAASFEAVAQPTAEVASSVKRACGDCHSNQTVWPWYCNLAPVSWLVAHDVNDGRKHLNFSAWNRPGPEGEMPDMGEACEQIRAGTMPLRSYAIPGRLPDHRIGPP